MRAGTAVRYMLLAPVPCCHLPSAIETCEAQGRVAFASQKWELFERDGPRTPATGWDVLIFASRPELGFPSDYRDRVSRVAFSGSFFRWVRAHRGRHPEPRVRPVSTETDTEVAGF